MEDIRGDSTVLSPAGCIAAACARPLCDIFVFDANGHTGQYVACGTCTSGSVAGVVNSRTYVDAHNGFGLRVPTVSVTVVPGVA